MPVDVVAESLCPFRQMSIQLDLWNTSDVRTARFSDCDEMRNRSTPPMIAVFGRPVSSRLRLAGG